MPITKNIIIPMTPDQWRRFQLIPGSKAAHIRRLLLAAKDRPPPQPPPKHTERFQFRLTLAETAELERQAQESGMGKAAYLRAILGVEP